MSHWTSMFPCYLTKRKFRSHVDVLETPNRKCPPCATQLAVRRFWQFRQQRCSLDRSTVDGPRSSPETSPRRLTGTGPNLRLLCSPQFGYGRAGGPRCLPQLRWQRRQQQQQPQPRWFGCRWELQSRAKRRIRRWRGGPSPIQHPGDSTLPPARMGPFWGAESAVGGGAGWVAGKEALTSRRSLARDSGRSTEPPVKCTNPGARVQNYQFSNW